MLSNLADRAGLNIVVGWSSPHPIDRNAAVAIHLKNVRFADALDAVLLLADQQHHLLWTQSDSVIKITSQEMVDPSQLLVRFYDIQPLVGKMARRPTTHPSTEVDQVDEIKGLITAQILSFSWADKPGEVGSISYFPHTLIIRQTPQAHRLIEAFLRELQERVN